MENNQLMSEKINNLLSQLFSSNLDIQTSAIYELGEMKAESAISSLVNLLNNKTTDLELKWVAIESLEKIGFLDTLEIDAVEALVRCLKDESEDINVRRAAIKVLCQQVNSGQTLLTLLRFANDEQQDTFLRQQVNYSLSNYFKQATEEAEARLQNKKEFLERLFAKDWDEPGKVLVSSNSRSASKKSPQSLISEIKVNRAKSINLENQEFALIINLKLREDEKVILLLEVQPLGDTRILPSGLEIAFLSPSNKVLKQTKAREADNLIRLLIPLSLQKIKLSQQQQKPFEIRVTLKDNSHTEKFPSYSNNS